MAHLRARRLRDGDLRYLQVLSNRLAVALDNARLVLAERQLEALVAGMEEAVTVRDGDGRILLGNDAAVRLLGASSQEELRRTSLTDLWRRFALYRPDGTPMSDGDLSWMRALQDERPPPMLMRRVDRGTGEEQWLLSKATVLHGGDGRPELVMNVTEDVTATTRSELGRRLLVDAGRLLSETDGLRGRAARTSRASWCPTSPTGAPSTSRAPAGYVHLAAVAHIDEHKVAPRPRAAGRAPHASRRRRPHHRRPPER